MAVTMPTVAIVGRSNVGKSSLFNRLTGRRQAVTSEVSGTTRDAVHGVVEWNGRAFKLIDTAGLETTLSELGEQIADQIQSAARMADCLIVTVDALVMPTEQDRAAAMMALRSGKPVILAVNKVDTNKGQIDAEFARLGIKTQVGVSAVHGIGTGDLLDAVTTHLPKANRPAEEETLRIALIGRPNVGKSSLYNSLAGKQQAIVSSAAGTTRDVRDLEMAAFGQKITLLDTAGLRRKGKIEAGIEKYSVTRTLSTIETSDVCCLILDATDLSVAGDHHLAGQILEAGKGLIIVVNKWDAVGDKDERTQTRLIRKIERDFVFAPWAPVVFTSAVTGEHVTQILKLATEIHERRKTKLPTHKLNLWLERVTAEHPPAGLKNRQPKIRYVTQTDMQPPTFLLFSTYASFMHFSYKRYLENKLRVEFDFVGTPIRFEFRDTREGKE